MKSFFSTLVVTLFFTAYSALAATPEAKLPYQKKLTAAPTASAASTPVAFTFTLWDAETSGTQKWIDIKSIPVTSATRLISTVLGDATPLNAADFNQQLWVQVEIGTTVIGTRDKLVAVPYALWSAVNASS
jgi:hypothetical protein